MGTTQEDEMNVDILNEIWTQLQGEFEMNIKMLLDKSKLLEKQLSNAATLKEPRLTQQKTKLNELIIHLNGELQHRQIETTAKQRLEEWQNCMDNMRSKISVLSQGLWQVGLIDKLTIDKLCESPEYTQHQYELLTQELQHCEMLRRQNLSTLIDHMRQEIDKWHDQTLQYPAVWQYQKEFYTEELLELLEHKLAELQDYYKTNKDIFKNYGRRIELWRRMEQLEESATNPNRFYNRNCQLLREERERNYIRNKLPAIEQKLSQLLQNYEQSSNQPFLVHGEDVLSRIDSEWEEYRRIREEKILARKKTLSDSIIKRSFLGSSSTVGSFTMRKTTSVPYFNQNKSRFSPRVWRNWAK